MKAGLKHGTQLSTEHIRLYHTGRLKHGPTAPHQLRISSWRKEGAKQKVKSRKCCQRAAAKLPFTSVLSVKTSERVFASTPKTQVQLIRLMVLAH